MEDARTDAARRAIDLLEQAAAILATESGGGFDATLDSIDHEIAEIEQAAGIEGEEDE